MTHDRLRHDALDFRRHDRSLFVPLFAVTLAMRCDLNVKKFTRLSRSTARACEDALRSSSIDSIRFDSPSANENGRRRERESMSIGASDTRAHHAMGGARNGGKTPKNAGALGGVLARARTRGTKKSTIGVADADKIAPHHREEGFINYAHITEITRGDGKQSVLERGDLDEFLHLASLANRDFAAERREGAMMVRDGVARAGTEDANASERGKARDEAETMYKETLSVPRRPGWTRETTAEELDANERRAFLEWRRALARVEEDGRCQLTPFEKNLEIWRQLWRVCERSDVIVQVVDARDPMFYRCEDLEAYVKELNPAKKTLLLLNKADLLCQELRRAWAAKFKASGIDFLFWSAKAAYEEIEAEAVAAKAYAAAAALEETNRRLELHAGEDMDDDAIELAAELSAKAEVARELAHAHAKALHEIHHDNVEASDPAHIWSRTELLDVLQRKAEEAVRDMGDSRPKRLGPQSHRVVVGMVGYPNVGKSSTVNAIVAEKKTGVSATPGKTKHFQTLELGDSLLLADCPGLVFPSFSSSKAELVCNGVIPIDRLTDVRAPIEIIAERIPRRAIEHVYNMKLPLPALHEDQNRNATAGEILRGYCASRGFTLVHGRPDEVRAGRIVLKDFINGKLLYCNAPEGYEGPRGAARLGEEHMIGYGAGAIEIKSSLEEPSSRDGLEDDPLATAVLNDMIETLGINNTKAKERNRPEHKYQKKAKKEKSRVKYLGSGVNTAVGGQGFLIGKRGGLMPASVQAQIRSSITDET